MTARPLFQLRERTMTLRTAAYEVVQRDITQVFNTQLQTAQPFYPELCTVVPSTSLDEKYAFLGSSQGVREWLGDRQFHQMRAADFVIKNKLWESSEEFEKTDVDDDRMGMFRPRIMSLADEAAYHPDELLFQTIGLGESTACFDGQYFFDTDHSWGSSGTQSNSVTYDMAGAAPTVAEFRSAFQAAMLKMLSFKNDKGKFYFRPTLKSIEGLIITVPPALWEVGVKAFEQAITLELSGSAAAAVTNVLLARPRVVPIPYLAGTETNGSDLKFDLYYTGGILRPFVFQAREPLRFQVKGADDIEYRVIKAMTEARYNVGYFMWPYAVRTLFN